MISLIDRHLLSRSQYDFTTKREGWEKIDEIISICIDLCAVKFKIFEIFTKNPSNQEFSFHYNFFL